MALKKLNAVSADLNNSILVGYLSFMQKVNFNIDESQLDDILR